MLNIARALALLGRREGIRIDSAALADAEKQKQFEDIESLSRYYRGFGLAIRTHNVSKNYALDNRTVPSAVILKDGRALCILGTAEAGPEGMQVSVIDPENPGVLDKIDLETLKSQIAGQALMLDKIGEEDRVSYFDKREILALFDKNKLASMMLILLSLTIALLGLTPIIYLQIALDKVIGYGATSTFGVLTVCVILAVLSIFVLGRFRDEILSGFGTELETRLNNSITDKAVSAARERRIEPGVAMAAQSAVDKIRALIIDKFLKNTLELANVVLLTPIVFLYNPVMGALIVLYCIIASAVNVILSKKSRERREDLNKTLAQRSGNAHDIMHAKNTLASFDIDARQNRSWLRAVRGASKKRNSLASVESASAQSTTCFQSGLTVLIIFSGVEMVLFGYLSPGSLIAINLLGSKILQPLLKFGSLVLERQNLEEAIEQVNAVISLPNTSKAPGLRPPITGQITFDKVQVDGLEETKLENFSLSLRAGSRAAFLSQNDLSCFTAAQTFDKTLEILDGTLALDEIDIKRIDDRWLAKRVFRIDQNPRFFEGTITDNVHGMHPDMDPRDLDNILATFGLADHAENMPEGLETKIASDGNPLTYAGRIELSLVRTLAAMPSILIIDGALDPMPIKTSARILQSIHQLLGGGSLIVSTVRSDIASMLGEQYLVSANSVEKVARSEPVQDKPKKAKAS